MTDSSWADPSGIAAGRGVSPGIDVHLVHGDLLDQHVDALVNPWNRNFVPRWLLRPGGVSGQLKRRTGPKPWRELRRCGTLAVGEAVITDGGLLPVDLIHVAGINAWWRASVSSVALSTHSVVVAGWKAGYRSLAMPLIGSGHGSLSSEVSLRTIQGALGEYANSERAMLVIVVLHS
ncbi:MAG: macro domain-containing protein [Nakamurella sp.]